MGDITTLFSEVNFPNVIIGVLLIFVCINFVSDLVGKIFNKFGVEFKGDREKKEDHKLLVETSESVKLLMKQQEGFSERLQKMEDDNKSYRMNDTRNELMKHYKYFANKKNNPMLAWTSIEHKSFMELLKVYEENDGNDFMHDVVVPEMNKLDIIDMADTDKLAQLYDTRSKCE